MAATVRQRKAAQKLKEVIEKNLDMSGGEVLKSVGYGTGLQNQPGRVFEGDGFKEAMADLGFSLEAADGVVAKILHTGKEENRLKASDQIYKRLGGYSPEKHLVANIELTPEVKELTEKLNELYRDTSE